MDMLLAGVFFALLFLLLGVTFSAGLTILFWSLLIFVVVSFAFVFYQYVREYEEEHGVGSWSFDPFVLLRRSRVTRVGEMRAEDLRRLKRVMRDLDYTDEEIEAYVALLEERADVDINEIALLDDEIRGIVILQKDGKLPAGEKERLLAKFKAGLGGIKQADSVGSAPDDTAPPPDDTAPDAPPPDDTAPPPDDTAPQPVVTAPPPVVIATCSPHGADLADVDYQLFRPRRDPALGSGCSKCVLDEFDSLSPRTLVPDTVEEYTLMLLGEKRSDIEDIVAKVQAKCFPTAVGDDRTRVIKTLTDTFTVYFFAHATPELPQHTLRYLNDVAAKPRFRVGSHNNDYGGGKCRMDVAAMKSQQNELTKAVHALYAVYRVTVMGLDVEGTADEDGPSPLDQLLNGASRSPTGFRSQMEFTEIGEGVVARPGRSGGRRRPRVAPLNFNEADLKARINAILTDSDADCGLCVQELLIEMQHEMSRERFFDQVRALRHTPMKKTAFMVEFLKVYFKHFAEYCVHPNDRREANVNMHIYARKFLALTQLMWAVILQTAARTTERPSPPQLGRQSTCSSSVTDQLYDFLYDEYYDVR